MHLHYVPLDSNSQPIHYTRSHVITKSQYVPEYTTKEPRILSEVGTDKKIAYKKYRLPSRSPITSVNNDALTGYFPRQLNKVLVYSDYALIEKKSKIIALW